MEYYPTWLNQYESNVTSQSGEDGIIEKILETLGETDGWCVEFGAWDGKHLSNTYNLTENKGYSAVLIEANPEKFTTLDKTYKNKPEIVTLNAFVGFDEDDNLDTLLEPTAIPETFDVLSIDIDGNDYHVFAAMTRYKPKIVVVEFNHTIPSHIDFVQEKNPSVAQGASLAAMIRLGKSKGYEAVATTRTNVLFVDERYFPLFKISDNSPDAIRRERSHLTYVFCGFDGTIFVHGNQELNWHGISYKSRLRQLPKWMRAYPNNYGRLQRYYHYYLTGGDFPSGVRTLIWHLCEDVPMLRALKNRLRG